MGKQVRKAFWGCTNAMGSAVAFSPDGKRVVSGSVGETVGFGDAERRVSRFGRQDIADLGCGDGEASGKAASWSHRLGGCLLHSRLMARA